MWENSVYQVEQRDRGTSDGQQVFVGPRALRMSIIRADSISSVTGCASASELVATLVACFFRAAG